MKIIKKIIKIFTNKYVRFYIFDRLGFYKKTSDEEYLKKKFKLCLGVELNLENPKRYNEKLQWLKLNLHSPLYVDMVDKYRVKDKVASIIGEEYIVPIYGVWNRPEEIDFDTLPQQFVLKTNNDSGGVIICKNKAEFNQKKAIKFLHKHLKNDYYLENREWPYKDVKKCVFAEKYMEDTISGELKDYKYFAFDGKVKAMFIAKDRYNDDEETKFDFFDENFNHLPFTNGHPNAIIPPSKPKNFDLMIELAEKLSKNIPHVRVDFYECNGKVYFGELTFFHWSGFKPFDPDEWDFRFGEWLKLPIE